MEIKRWNFYSFTWLYFMYNLKFLHSKEIYSEVFLTDWFYFLILLSLQVTFLRFDCQSKVFNVFQTAPPPGISYGEFSDPHVMCIENGSIFIHTPAKSSLVFDESGSEWVTHHRRLSSYSDHRFPTDLPYHGYEVYTCVGDKMFVIQNPAAYTTSTTCISESRTRFVVLLILYMCTL